MRRPGGWMRWVGVLTLVACTGNNPAAPGATNPNLPGATGTSTGPGKAETVPDRITIKGAVADSRTGEVVPRATLFYRVVPVEPFAPAFEGSGSLEASASTGDLSLAPPLPLPSAPPGASSPPTRGNAGRLGAAAPRRPAPTPVPPDALRKAVADDRGQFELRDVAPGTLQVTCWAPGHEALTVSGSRPTQLQFSLEPLEPGSGITVRGQVLAGGDRPRPAAGIRVTAASRRGELGPELATTDAEGTFSMSGFQEGKTSLGALLVDGEEVKAWGFLDEVRVHGQRDKAPASPSLTLRAATHPVFLAGTVTSPVKTLLPRQVLASLVTPRGEMPILTRVPDPDGFFRFALPALAQGHAYRLVATGLEGQATTRQARGELGASDQKIELALPKPMIAPDLSWEGDEGSLRWEAVPGASAYLVQIETAADESRAVWRAHVVGTRVSLPLPADVPLLSRGISYRLTVTAIQVADRATWELTELSEAPWIQRVSHEPLTFQLGQPLSGNPLAAGEASPSVQPDLLPPPVKPSVKAVPSAAPRLVKPAGRGKPKAPVKPSPKPLRKPTRT